MNDKEIREAFSTLYEDSKRFIIGPMPDKEDSFSFFKSGYTAAMEKTENRFESLKVEYNKSNAKIIKLKKQIESMKCCGNCGNEYNHFVDREVCYTCTRYSGTRLFPIQKDLKDHWQPKEKS